MSASQRLPLPKPLKLSFAPVELSVGTDTTCLQRQRFLAGLESVTPHAQRCLTMRARNATDLELLLSSNAKELEVVCNGFSDGLKQHMFAHMQLLHDSLQWSLDFY